MELPTYDSLYNKLSEMPEKARNQAIEDILEEQIHPDLKDFEQLIVRNDPTQLVSGICYHLKEATLPSYDSFCEKLYEMSFVQRTEILQQIEKGTTPKDWPASLDFVFKQSFRKTKLAIEIWFNAKTVGVYNRTNLDTSIVISDEKGNILMKVPVLSGEITAVKCNDKMYGTVVRFSKTKGKELTSTIRNVQLFCGVPLIIDADCLNN